MKSAPVGSDTAEPKAMQTSSDEPVTAWDLITSNLVGRYENHQYDDGGKNDWHYVELVVEDGRLYWRNRGGVSWTLLAAEDPSRITVGTDCIYYSKGYRSMVVEWTDDGQVRRILGPGNEWYDRAN